MDQGPSVLAPGLSHAPAADLLPHEGEAPHAYRARLWALHDQLASLIDAAERAGGDPSALVAVPDVEGHLAGAGPSRTADRIAVARHALERQANPATDPFAARAGMTSRIRARVPTSRPDVDPVVVCWAINVVCWLLISGVALIWGLGSN
jgi:hypothetical protein